MNTSKKANGGTARKNYMVWQGRPLPCQVKAAVYENGMAAGIGIKGTNRDLLEKFLMDSERFLLFRQQLRQQIDAELAARGVTHGIDEEEIAAAIETFMEAAASGNADMVSRRVATGQAAGEGMDGCFEYAFNPSGLPLRLLDRPTQLREGRRMHPVKEGETLVRHQPPEKGTTGQDVRGRVVQTSYEPRDVSLSQIAGANTEVQGERLVSTIDGVYREGASGEVRVVQEVETEEVNAATGDLPAVGIGDINVWVKRGVFGGAGLLTSENAFVGSLERPGVLEDGTRVRARNLSVCGQIAGGQLPPQYLTEEVEALDPEEREKVFAAVEKGLVEAEELLAARDVTGRNVRADDILVQSHAYAAALEARNSIRVDGDLVGGLVVCGGSLQVVGDLGNVQETVTRIQIDTQVREAQKLQRVKEQLLEARHGLADCRTELQEHMNEMQERGKQSQYWAALLEDETKPPSKPIEKQLLGEFIKGKKRTQDLEREIRGAQRHVWDLEELMENEEEEEQAVGGDFRITVGGTIYPGVRVELVRALSADDLKRSVKNRAGMDTALQMVRNKLAEQVDHHIELYREGVEERRKAMEEIYRDSEEKPEGPEIPDKRFQEQVTFPDTEKKGGEGGLDMIREGVVYVYAHDPTNFHLQQMTRIREPLQGATIKVEQGEEDFVLTCSANKEAVASWQKDDQVLENLEEIWVMGQSARSHLLGHEPTVE